MNEAASKLLVLHSPSGWLFYVLLVVERSKYVLPLRVSVGESTLLEEESGPGGTSVCPLNHSLVRRRGGGIWRRMPRGGIGAFEAVPNREYESRNSFRAAKHNLSGKESSTFPTRLRVDAVYPPPVFPNCCPRLTDVLRAGHCRKLESTWNELAEKLGVRTVVEPLFSVALNGKGVD